MEKQWVDYFKIQIDNKIHLNFSLTSLSEERTKVELTHLPCYLLDATEEPQKYVKTYRILKESSICEDCTSSMN